MGSQRRAATGVASAAKHTTKSSPSIAPRLGAPAAVRAYTPSASTSRVWSFAARSADEANGLLDIRFLLLGVCGGRSSGGLGRGSGPVVEPHGLELGVGDRKSTRLNSSH